MNLFEERIRNGTVKTEGDLKRLFRKLAKRLHPDSAGMDTNQAYFVKLKADFDIALAALRVLPPESDHGARHSDFGLCTRLFCELMASGFPVDPHVKARNKGYNKRLTKLNDEVGRFGGDFVGLFSRVERELYGIRGETAVLNHEYNVIKTYLYNVSDWYDSGSLFANTYIKASYDLVVACLRDKKADNVITFIEWIVRNVP